MSPPQELRSHSRPSASNFGPSGLRNSPQNKSWQVTATQLDAKAWRHDVISHRATYQWHVIYTTFTSVSIPQTINRYRIGVTLRAVLGAYKMTWGVQRRLKCDPKNNHTEIECGSMYNLSWVELSVNISIRSENHWKRHNGAGRQSWANYWMTCNLVTNYKLLAWM